MTQLLDPIHVKWGSPKRLNSPQEVQDLVPYTINLTDNYGCLCNMGYSAIFGSIQLQQVNSPGVQLY